MSKTRMNSGDSEQLRSVDAALLAMQSAGVPLPAGGSVRLSAAVSRRDAVVLRDIVRDVRPRASMEVGLGYGVSAMFIIDGLRQVGGVRHHVIDPYQGRDWWSGGLFTLQRLGLQPWFCLYEQSTSEAVSDMVARGVRVQFAFIDGSHSFQNVLLDIVAVDRVLDDGGVVVLDDCDFHSVLMAVRFLERNGPYVPVSSGMGWKTRTRFRERWTDGLQSLGRSLRKGRWPSRTTIGAPSLRVFRKESGSWRNSMTFRRF